MDERKTGVVLIFAVLCIAVFGGIFLTRNLGKTDKQVSEESAVSQMEKMYGKIAPGTGAAKKSPVEFTSNEMTADELPDINTCDVMVQGRGSIVVEIWSSPEKAGTGADSWLVDVASAYNAEKHQIGSGTASVTVRKVNSGQMIDYIATGKATPDAYSPSSIMWAKMLENKGVQSVVISDRIVGNTAGIVLKKSVYDEFVKEYGEVDLKAVTDAVADGKYTIGYTNPFSSTAGMNFLMATLNRYDSSNPLSDTAMEGFRKFQLNVPFVAINTPQMRTASENGSMDGFIMEYQTYIQDANMSRNYTFTPYGYRHDNPLVALSGLSSDKMDVLKDFAEYCLSDKWQKKATELGFNGMENYKSETQVADGSTLVQAQKLYKQNKDNGQAVAAVFVADISGSMSGEPISSLKDSLVNSMKYINQGNYIGLVSYSSDVTIEVPLGVFDLNQQSLFKGSVEGLQANGQTATYDALIVASKMLRDACEQDPNIKPIIILLSDGETNSGFNFKEVSGVISGLRYPVYTIGYNANIEALKSISSINEAASINASTDDIVYQLKLLFEANM